MRVYEIMSGDIRCCTPETRLQDVARMMATGDIGAIPVVSSSESMRPIGIVTDRDITVRCVARGMNPLEMSAGDCMSSDISCVRADDELDRCLNRMESKQVRRMPVIDERGRLCGIVAQADIARHLKSSETAELVRDVSQPTEYGEAQGMFH